MYLHCVRAAGIAALLALSLSIASCGGGNTSPQGSHGAAPSADPAVDAYGPLEVSMQPQPQAIPPFLSRGASFALPQPSGPGQRRASFSPDGLSRTASQFEAAEALSRVSVDGLSADFSPAGADFSGMAFCSYRFQLDDYSASGQAQTLALDWDPAQAPADFGQVWVALANWPAGRWDWFSGPADGVLTLDSLSAYTSAGGEARVMIVLTGSDPATLRQLRIGGAELRGTGGVDEQPLGEQLPILSLPGVLSASVDLSPECPPVHDQGSAASCAAFALADGAFAFQLGQLYSSQGWDFNNAANLPSARYLYVETGKNQSLGCPEDGRSLTQSALYLQTSGTSTELNAPYAQLCDDAWTQGALDDAAMLQIDSYSMQPLDSPARMTNARAVLALQHRPLVLVTRIDNAFRYYDPADEWAYSGPQIGVHAMLIVGYDDARQAFKVRNSWGSDWGDNGHVWIAYSSFDHDNGSLAWALVLGDDFSSDLAEFYCGSSPDLDPPAGLQASDGLYTDRIALSWSAVDGASGYYVYRDSQDNQIAVLNDGFAQSYDDLGISDFLGHSYWVSAFDGQGESELSSVDTGFLDGTPTVVSVTPLSGISGESLNISAVVDGDQNLSFSWTFGGDITPGTSSAENPLIDLGAAGSYDCELEVSNSFGSNTFPFTITVVAPESVVNVPEVGGPASQFMQIFFANPKLRRNDDVQIDLLNETFDPVDPVAYNDVLKEGDEFLIQFQSPIGVFPRIIMVPGTDAIGIVWDDPNELPGVILVDSYLGSGRLIVDIAALPNADATPDDYAYKLFSKDTSAICHGFYVKQQTDPTPGSIIGAAWGVNAFNRSGQSSISDGNFGDKSVEGSTVGTSTPDVIWVRFDGGWVEDFSGNSGVRMIIENTDTSQNANLYLELRAAGLGAGGEYLMTHVLTASDFFDGVGPGQLIAGQTYDVYLDYNANPGAAWYFGSGARMTVSSGP